MYRVDVIIVQLRLDNPPERLAPAIRSANTNDLSSIQACCPKIIAHNESHTAVYYSYQHSAADHRDQDTAAQHR